MELDAYQVLKKDGTYTLIIPTDQFFLWEIFVRNYETSYRGEPFDLRLHTASIERTLSLFRQKREEKVSPAAEIAAAPIIMEDTIKKGLMDTLYRDESMTVKAVGYQMIQNYTLPRGFYGFLHKLFPIVFIMHGVIGYLPMAFQLMAVQPHYFYQIREHLNQHYQVIEMGVRRAFQNLRKVVLVENRALLMLEEIIRKNSKGQGYNQAALSCGMLGLGFLHDYFWAAAQSTEMGEWQTKLSREPVMFFELKPTKEKLAPERKKK